MIGSLITATLFVFLYIFWPPSIQSVQEITPYISDMDVSLIWGLVLLWAMYGVYYILKQKGGEDDL